MSARPSSLRNCAAMMLLAVALLLQAATPQGWMLESDASGQITIEICNSDQVLVIPAGDASPAHDVLDDEAKPVCTFAGLQDSGIDADPNLRLPLPQLAEAAYDALRAKALSPDTPASLPPATGPPSLA